MSSKIYILLFVCLIVVAVQATFPEESRDEGMEKERCMDFKLCDSRKVCHECCNHNFYLDLKDANGDDQLEHQAVYNMCECYNDVYDNLHGHSRPQ